MKRRAFLGLGVSSIGVGALYGTGAFSAVSAGRNIAVSAADGLDALLGIESEGDVGEIRGGDDPVTVGTLKNNLEESVTVEDIVIDSIGDDDTNDDVLTIEDPSPGDTIESGTPVEVRVSCADDQSIGEHDVVVRIVGVDGTNVRISEPRFSFTADIQCGKGNFSGSAQFSVADVSTDDTTQTLSFNIEELKNGDQATIDFSDPQENDGVDYSQVTDQNVTITSGQSGSLSFDSSIPSLTYTADRNVKGELTVEIEEIVVIGDPGESYLVEYSDTVGRDDGNFFEIQ